MLAPPPNLVRQYSAKNPPLELYKPHIVDTPEGEITNVFTHRTRLYIAAVVAAVYPIMFVFYVVFEDGLWKASVDTSAYLSQFDRYKWYSTIFSEIFYKWYPFVFGLLLVISPRKDSALKAGFIFYASHLFRNYLRLWIKETRPYYTTLRIKERASCNCSFGMPSGHSEGTAMLYSIILYDWVLQTRHYAKWKKILGIFIVAWITISVMFSRVYYGKHSLPQVFLGTGQALFFLSLMCIYDDRLDLYFHDFLQRKRYAVVSLFIICLSTSIINIVAWIAYFDKKTGDYEFFFVRCSKCFEDENLKTRQDLATSLVFTSMTLGLIGGYILAKVHYEGHNDYMVNQHFSLKGLARISLMLLWYSPLLIIMFTDLEPKVGVIVYSLVYILVGFLASFVDTKVRRWLKLEFKGDILAGVHGEEYLKQHDAPDDADIIEEMNLEGVEGTGKKNPFLESHVPVKELNNAYHDPKLSQHMRHDYFHPINGHSHQHHHVPNTTMRAHSGPMNNQRVQFSGTNHLNANPLMGPIGSFPEPLTNGNFSYNPFAN